MWSIFLCICVADSHRVSIVVYFGKRGMTSYSRGPWTCYILF